MKDEVSEKSDFPMILSMNFFYTTESFELQESYFCILKIGNTG